MENIMHSLPLIIPCFYFIPAIIICSVLIVVSVTISGIAFNKKQI